MRALELLEAVNSSAVGTFFAAHAGRTVTLAGVAAAFDKAFGPGAGERVRLRCRNIEGQTVITGLTIGLSSAEGEMSTLVRGASATKSSCDGGFLAQAAAD